MTQLTNLLVFLYFSYIVTNALLEPCYETWYLGNALITVATGTLSEVTADRTGLVSAHAYAVLSIREIKVMLYSVRVYACSTCKYLTE